MNTSFACIGAGHKYEAMEQQELKDQVIAGLREQLGYDAAVSVYLDEVKVVVSQAEFDQKWQEVTRIAQSVVDRLSQSAEGQPIKVLVCSHGGQKEKEIDVAGNDEH